MKWLGRGILWGVALVLVLAFLGGAYQFYVTWQQSRHWYHAWQWGLAAFLKLLIVFWPLEIALIGFMVLVSWLWNRFC